MAAIRYKVIQELPAVVREAAFAEVGEGQIRVRMRVEDGELIVVATGADVRACEEILIRLGATEIGVDLCG